MFETHTINYSDTHAFSKIVQDYLSGKDALKNFYQHTPDLDGIKAAIKKRESAIIDRELLVKVLKEQYRGIETTDAVHKNIEALRHSTTFTICTAHQPNLFTGPLYFVYKVIHVIKLANLLKEEIEGYDFVPVYYMGSEDADFAELNHTYVHGKKIEWKKEQKGAVGRMKVDNTLLQLIQELQGQLSHEPHGQEVVEMLQHAYSDGRTIQDATFELVNLLYAKWGLVVLIPDHPRLKAMMIPFFEDDILNHTPSSIVSKTSAQLDEHYNAQAHPRDINLFYLKDDIRERIVVDDDHYKVLNTDLIFSKEDLLQELKQHPERFSPNVILRGLYQEMILPGVAFVGGGGELAYWLQLKDLFALYEVPYPVLVLRNSFLYIDERSIEQMKKMGLNFGDIFLDEQQILNKILEREGKKPELNGELDQVRAIYETLRQTVQKIDVTLQQHVAALEAKHTKQLMNLEKKMIRAEKKKHVVMQGQLQKLKDELFPNQSLQERTENFSGYYAKWGGDFLNAIYEASSALDQQFTILYQKS